MSNRKFIECNRDQLFLLPPSVKDWLPVGHLAFFILETMKAFDMRELYERFKSQFGRPAYRPEVMLAIWLYAYCVGTRSSRRVERALHEDVAFRVISANQQPDYKTLSEFRRRHHHVLGKLFNQTVKLAQKAGLVKGSVIAKLSLPDKVRPGTW